MVVRKCSTAPEPARLQSQRLFCDFVTSRYVTRLHNLCLAVCLAPENRFSTAALLSVVVLGQACASWPIRGEGGALKRQEIKQRVSDRGDSVLAFKAIQTYSSHHKKGKKPMNLQISIISLL